MLIKNKTLNPKLSGECCSFINNELFLSCKANTRSKILFYCVELGPLLYNLDLHLCLGAYKFRKLETRGVGHKIISPLNQLKEITIAARRIYEIIKTYMTVQLSYRQPLDMSKHHSEWLL